MLLELLRYRRFIVRRALAELRHRYAGTGMGLVWNILHPLALIGVYALVFSTLMAPKLPGSTGRFDYVLYLCCGFLPWVAFAEIAQRGTASLLDNAAYLRKLPVPEPVFVAASAVAATIGLAISFALLAIFAVALGHPPTWHWLLLPLPLLAMQLMGFAAGLVGGTLNVLIRDTGQLVQVLLTLLIWTLPIVYVADILPDPARRLLTIHPLYPPLVAVRDLFLYARLPSPAVVAGLILWPTLLLTLAAAVFTRARTDIRDNL